MTDRWSCHMVMLELFKYWPCTNVAWMGPVWDSVRRTPVGCPHKLRSDFFISNIQAACKEPQGEHTYYLNRTNGPPVECTTLGGRVKNKNSNDTLASHLLTLTMTCLFHLRVAVEKNVHENFKSIDSLSGLQFCYFLWAICFPHTSLTIFRLQTASIHLKRQL